MVSGISFIFDANNNQPNDDVKRGSIKNFGRIGQANNF